MHLSRRYGATLSLVEADGFPPAELLPFVADEEPGSPLQQASQAMALVGAALARTRADALLLVGDRSETLAAAVAASMARVPIVHLHGGEETLGSIDNNFRNAITKLSHLHLVSHPRHAANVVALGERPDSVRVVGAPGLDNLLRTDLAGRAELEAALGIPLHPPLVVVTMHPSTALRDPVREIQAVCEAMDAVEATYVITLPNNDPGSQEIRQTLAHAAAGPRRTAVAALGDRRYCGLMKLADALLGNSSSALIEAPLLALPAVNVGERQRGRLRAANVLDAASEATAVIRQLRRALSREFRESLSESDSPYGDGRSSERIRDILVAWTPPESSVKLLHKGVEERA